MAKPDGAETCGSCHGEGYIKPKVQTFDSLAKEHNMYIKKKKDKSWTEILLAFILSPVATVTGGFVLAQLWNWFVPTVFESLPHLTTGQGVGLHCFIGFLKVGLATTIWKEDERGQEYPEAVKLLVLTLAYGMILLGGFIIHLIIH